jgi:biopolymer transport protein ExbB/TolQ
MKNPLTEIMFQFITLLLSATLIHAIYSAQIRPQANALMAEQQVQIESGVEFNVTPSFLIIVKDYEQEICFILMLWAITIIGYKSSEFLKQRNYLKDSLINVTPGIRILPEDSWKYSRPIQALDSLARTDFIPRTLLTALQRFGTTEKIQDVSQVIKDMCETEAERLDSQLSTIRYIVWAIPSVGFIGTVRGISQALGQAHKAVNGDITGVTANLGIAFNSTFIALVISLFVMLLMHQLQRAQEQFVLDSQQYCEASLTRHLANK